MLKRDLIALKALGKSVWSNQFKKKDGRLLFLKMGCRGCFLGGASDVRLAKITEVADPLYLLDF
jgi:hypothetical protein